MAELIETTKGFLDPGVLEKKAGAVNNDHEYTVWTEYWLDGEIVRRDVHVTLKPEPCLVAEAGSFN